MKNTLFLMCVLLGAAIAVGCTGETKRFTVTSADGKEYQNLELTWDFVGGATFEDSQGKQYTFCGEFTMVEE